MELREPGWEMRASLWLSARSLAREREALRRICESNGGVVLFGSFARGDHDEQSDVDVMVLSDQSHRAQLDTGTRLSVTVYSAQHLESMARHGSLFVLHLIAEGHILRDDDGLLRKIFDGWHVADHDKTCEGILAAAEVVTVASRQLAAEVVLPVSLFVLRSAVYSECLRRGSPAFALPRVSKILSEPDVLDLLSRRAASKPVGDRLAACLSLTHRVLGRSAQDRFDDLEAFAVAWHTKYPMASHLAVQLLTNQQGIQYERAPAPWVGS